jgi:hypothetical protein
MGAIEKPELDIFKFEPAGPVSERFIHANGPIDLIRGPWGSGKTVAAVFKIVRMASNLYPVCKDGIIHVRCACVRDTYRELAKTALPSWHTFFPANGPYTARVNRKPLYSGGIDRPVEHVLAWEVPRLWPNGWKMTPVRLEMQFGAIGNENLESFFKGYEISCGWINECDLLHEDVPGLLYGRTGRYPRRDTIMEWEGDRLGWEVDPDSGERVIKVPRVIFGDFNPPDETNWTYKREIEEPEKWPGYNFFAQPSGLSPNAENRKRKSRADYEIEEKNFGGPKAPDAIRNVHGRYAPKRIGTTVYDKFDLERHRADQALKPVRELPFYLGLDAGGRPACGIGQFMPNGQFRALREIISPDDQVTGPSRFAQNIVEVLLRDFPGMVCGGAWGDPSAWYGADREAGELAFMETVSLALSIPIMPTETNDISSRIEAVDWYLDGVIDANTPRSIWCPTLKFTVRGFVSQYHLTKNASAGKSDRLDIAKNEYSHIHDAWQYLLLGYRGLRKVQADSAKAGRGPNVVPMRQRQSRPAEQSIWDI